MKFSPHFIASFTLGVGLFASVSAVRAASGTGNSDDYNGPIGVTGTFNAITTGCSYDPASHNAKRQIDDIVVPGSVGKYPLKMTRYFDSRGDYAWGVGLGPCWTMEYNWFVWADTIMTGKVITPQGATYDYRCDAPIGVSEGWESHPSPGTGVFRLADGGKVNFVNYGVTWIDDPNGQRTTMHYGANGLDRVTEPGGRYLEFIYKPDKPNLIWQVVAHSGAPGNDQVIDSVTYTYTPEPAHESELAMDVLTGVTYSDGTTATYSYRSDNVTENIIVGQPVRKQFPVLNLCQDVRYQGPMHDISYKYDANENSPSAPHGAILREENVDGTLVSRIQPALLMVSDPPRDYTETRGDGATRTFHYTAHNTVHDAQATCPEMEPGNPPVQFLESYTDFEGHTTWLNYDPNTWLITSVVDGRGSSKDDSQFMTTYVRGSAFGQGGIGQITDIVHPDGSFVHYTYASDPHYVTDITDERGNITHHQRDPATMRVTQTDYKDHANGDAVVASESFIYDEFGFGLVKAHHLTNGAYQHYAYDARGLMTDKWNPTTNATPQANDAKIHYDYYTSGPWTDRVQTETDQLGRRIQYEYDRMPDYSDSTFPNGQSTGAACAGRGLVTKISYLDDKHGGAYPNGTVKTFAYDKFGNKVWEKNELGQRTTYVCDDYNRLLSVSTPLPGGQLATTSYTYTPTNGTNTSPYVHTTNSPKIVTTPDQIVTTNLYDKNFRKKSSAAGGSTIWFAYDAVGNQTKITDPRGTGPGDNYTAFTTATEYDTRNRKTSVTDAGGHASHFYYEDGINLTRIVRTDGSTETKKYDALNRVKVHTVPKEGTPTNVTENITTKFIYNPSGTLYSVEDGKHQITTFDYDPSDLKTKMIYPNGDYQQWTYDSAKNLLARRSVNGTSELFSYDERNRKISMAWSNAADWANFDYDLAGRMTAAENPSSKITREYDEGGRLKLDRQRLRIVPVSAVSRKAHAGAGSFDIALPLVGAPGVECRKGSGLQFNEYQLIVTFPRVITLSSVMVTTGAGTINSYGLDTTGKKLTIDLKEVTNAQTLIVTLIDVRDGTVTNNVAIGMRVLLGDVTGNGMVSSGDVATVQGQVGATVGQSNFRYDVNGTGTLTSGDVATVQGQVGSSVPSGSTLAFSSPSSPDVEVDYSYDAAGKVTGMSIPGVTGTNYGLSYDYTDPLGRLKTISGMSGASFSYSYDTASNETKRSCTVNGIAIDQDYGTPDSLNRKPQRDVKKNGTLVSGTHEAYGYDPLRPALLTSVQRTDGTDSFTYNLDNELASAAYAATSRSVGYVWDPAGNRSSMTDNQGPSATYATTTLNQYLSDGTNNITNSAEYHWLANYQNITYNYINDAHLSSVSTTDINGVTTSYQLNYDALGRCVVRVLTIGSTATTTYFIYDGEKPIAEYRGNFTQPLALNVYGKGIDEILMRIDSSVPAAQQPYFYQSDHEGCVTHLLDVNGSVIESYRYDAFGKPTIRDASGAIINSTAFDNRFMFTGREYVPQFGIYEYRARAYHPGLGRFMSEDPKLFVRGIGLGASPNDWSFEKHPDDAELNLFRYCGNDPIDFTDPMGLKSLSDYYYQATDYFYSGAQVGFDARHIFTLARVEREATRAGLKAQIDENRKALRLNRVPHPDVYNAVQHVYGAAELTRTFGEKIAKNIADKHESHAGDSRDSSVDRFHNNIGFEHGRAMMFERTPVPAIQGMLKDGRLIIDKQSDKRDQLQHKGNQ